MKKIVYHIFLQCILTNYFLYSMENKLILSQKEIERLAELMEPISEGTLLNQEEQQEFMQLKEKMLNELEKRKQELLEKQSSKNND